MAFRFFPRRAFLFAFALGLLPRAEAASLYNLMGSESGFGDVVGPYLLAKKGAAEEKTYLLLDDRAEMVMKTFLESPEALPAIKNIVFVRPGDLPSLHDVDRVYETFAGARGGAKLDPALHLPKAPRTTLVTQDLHSPHGRPYFPLPLRASGLGEVRSGAGHFYFSAAGLGRDRLGMLADPSVDAYVGLNAGDARAAAASHFGEGPIGAILRREKHPAALLSFAYGIHNEVFANPPWKPYPGQFKSYLKGLARIARREGKPIVLFTPNKLDVLTQTGAGGAEELSDFAARKGLRAGQVYVVSTGKLSNSQFTALTAAADLPYLIEGDSALSAAVRLGKPFSMMKGPWGLFGIDGLSTALTEAGAPWAKDIYPILHEPGKDTPSFARLDEIRADPAAFRRLKENTRDWQSSLEAITALAEGRRAPAEVFAAVPDPLLRYSWARDQAERGLMSKEAFRASVADLPDLAQLEALVNEKRGLPPPPAACAQSFAGLAKSANKAKVSK